jgi:hydroxymethylbilane synthase
VLEREDPRDAFVSNDYASLDELPAGAVVGTSSLRRQALIAARYPHLVIKPLRGNLDTRLGKLDRGDYAAIILAAAGLKRLGLPRASARCCAESACRPPGQGAMAIEIAERTDGLDLMAMLAPLNHEAHRAGVTAERKVSKYLAAAARCRWPRTPPSRRQMHLRAMVATPDGKRMPAPKRGPAERPKRWARRWPNCCARRMRRYPVVLPERSGAGRSRCPLGRAGGRCRPPGNA